MPRRGRLLPGGRGGKPGRHTEEGKGCHSVSSDPGNLEGCFRWTPVRFGTRAQGLPGQFGEWGNRESGRQRFTATAFRAALSNTAALVFLAGAVFQRPCWGRRVMGTLSSGL